MEACLPLSALLSQVLVAFIIEFDNEFEHQVPHRTTNHGSTPGSKSAPWLVSMAMWLRFMQFVPSEGIPVDDLFLRVGLPRKDFQTWLTRMSKWWGYVSVNPGPNTQASNLGTAMIVLPTTGGKRAVEVWRPLTGVIEKRWRERFGKEAVDQLCKLLGQLVEKLNHDMADSLPILGYEMFSKVPDHGRRARTKTNAAVASAHTLPVLLSKLLLAFAVEFENDCGWPLAISANVVRLIGEKGLRVRDIPRLAGVSKEAVAMALKRLEESKLVSVGPESANSRAKIVALTAKGLRMQESYLECARKVERHWQTSFGKDPLDQLRLLLEQLTGESDGHRSPLFKGLKPYADGWRASVPQPEVLPHYPMILHRGGFPDGS